MVKIVLAYNELEKNLLNFRNGWERWIKSYYNKPVINEYNIKSKILDIIHYYHEIYHFLSYEDRKLIEEIQSWSWKKISIFNVWEFIINFPNSTYEYSYHDNELYIPNYSLILSDVKSVKNCSNEELKLFANILENMSISVDNIDNYYCKVCLKLVYEKEQFDRNNIWENIPTILEEKYFLFNNPYVLKIHIPEEINYIQNIIISTDEAIKQLNNNIIYCKQIIEKYSSNENKELLRMILNSYNDIKK